jgi:hypothetical protein
MCLCALGGVLFANISMVFATKYLTGSWSGAGRRWIAVSASKASVFIESFGYIWRLYFKPFCIRAFSSLVNFKLVKLKTLSWNFVLSSLWSVCLSLVFSFYQNIKCDTVQFNKCVIVIIPIAVTTVQHWQTLYMKTCMCFCVHLKCNLFNVYWSEKYFKLQLA